MEIKNGKRMFFIGFLHSKARKVLSFSVMLLFSVTVLAQNIAVKGVVKDKLGEAMIGVTVIDVATQTIVVTDDKGAFTISTNPSTSTLSFNYTSYNEQKVKLNGRTELVVIMVENIEMLEEVVVIGYGTVKRKDLTGAVTSIKGEALNKFPAPNVTELLKGQGTGISVTGSPAPGGASNIRIRGNRSLSAGQGPMYIVDGMMVPHINDLNSQDIASLDVLKDASSQAIYGSRASNGVILITTKRGRVGKVSVDVSSYLSFQGYKRNFDLYSPSEFLDLAWWVKKNGGASENIIGDFYNKSIEAVLGHQSWIDSYNSGSYTDWEKEMYSTAVMHKHDVSIRGGTDMLRYSLSAGFMAQDGMIEGSGYDRGSLRSNVDFAPYKWLDLGVNFSFTRSETQTADGRFARVLTIPQHASPYDKNGNLVRMLDGDNLNPVWLNRESKNQTNDDYLNLGAFFVVKPLKGLSYKFSANIRANNREVGTFQTTKYSMDVSVGSIRNFNRSSYLIDNVLNYSMPFNNKEKHDLQLTLIQTVDQDREKTTGFNFRDTESDDFGWDMAAQAEITGVTRSITQKRSVSFAARVQYNFMERYLLTASIRRDGASVFGADNKWANFPSVAFAWKFNEEPFMKDIKWIDQLKPRISYGVVGNWGINAYTTLGVAGKSEYILDGKLVFGYLPSSNLPNTSLKWETTRSLNVGVDFSAFKGRLNASFEYYKTNTNDILINRILPAITTYSSMWDNLGKTESNGIELSIDGTIVRTEDLEWNLGISFSSQSSKITHLEGGKDDVSNGRFIGHSPNNYYGYVFDRIWQEEDNPQPNEYITGTAKPSPGHIKLLDYNGDGEITTDDRKIFNRDPQWYGSITTSLYYKGFDVSVDFYMVNGVTKDNPYLYSFDYGGSLEARKNGIKVNYWTPENRSNDAPKPQAGGNTNTGILGRQKADYFRMRSATIGYTLPSVITRKAYIEKARFYITATNIFTITDFQSYSPEVDPSGYPEPRTIAFGVNLTF